MEKMADKYSSLSSEFDQQRQEYRRQHDEEDMDDWQYEIEMEQNVRHIAEMQAQLSREILSVSPSQTHVMITELEL